jgi:hypothetical protein
MTTPHSIKCPDCAVLTTVRNKHFGVHFATVTDQRPCKLSYKQIPEALLIVVQKQELPVAASVAPSDVVEKTVDRVERFRDLITYFKQQAWKWWMP